MQHYCIFADQQLSCILVKTVPDITTVKLILAFMLIIF